MSWSASCTAKGFSPPPVCSKGASSSAAAASTSAVSTRGSPWNARAYCAPSEDEQVGERVAAQAVGAVEPTSHLAGGVEAGDRRRLRLGVDTHAAHHVVRGGEDLHRVAGDVDVGQLVELLPHGGELLPDLLRLALRGDVEEGAA